MSLFFIAIINSRAIKHSQKTTVDLFVLGFFLIFSFEMRPSQSEDTTLSHTPQSK